jgi:hypothetical protein
MSEARIAILDRLPLMMKKPACRHFFNYTKTIDCFKKKQDENNVNRVVEKKRMTDGEIGRVGPGLSRKTT